jgi:hypothetical protein
MGKKPGFGVIRLIRDKAGVAAVLRPGVDVFRDSFAYYWFRFPAGIVPELPKSVMDNPEFGRTGYTWQRHSRLTG